MISSTSRRGRTTAMRSPSTITSATSNCRSSSPHLQQVLTHSSIRTTYDFLNPKAHDADEVTSYNLIDFQNCNPLGHSIAQQHLNDGVMGWEYLLVTARKR